MSSVYGGGEARQRGPAAEVERLPIYNTRGIIAESYPELQGLAVLEAARQAHPLPKASSESTLRAVFQAVEIALLNLADLFERAAADLDARHLGTAVVKMFWARGFHRVLARLGMMPHQLGLGDDAGAAGGVLRIRDSAGLRAYLDALIRFDQSVRRRFETRDLDLDQAVADRSLDSAEFNLIHLARVCNHEATIWEHNLTEIRVPATVPSYEEFVAARRLRDAVYDRVLTGDTYFTQFRGLHQIPEILGEEVNDRLEQAIREIRADRLRQAAEHLGCANVLTEGMLASLPPMADGLATSDYHQIRENLGLTSGSHSVCLRYHLFTHLYEQLWDALRARIARTIPGCPDDEDDAAIGRVGRLRRDAPDVWMLHLLSTHCLHLRATILRWRDEHVHLPRNNLGGDFTKSLTGSPDAVQAVTKMRDGARLRDPMLPLARARGLATAPGSNGSLTAYLESPASLDTHLLRTVGHITQRRFKDVQERLGFFANRCPFTPPPRRTA